MFIYRSLNSILYLFIFLGFTQHLISQNFFDDQKILEVDKAFKLQTTQLKSQNKIVWLIEDNYFLYKDSIKIKHKDNELDFHFLTKSEKYADIFLGDSEIFRSELVVKIQHSLRQGDGLKIDFQGCAENIYCYSPVQREIIF